VASLVLDAGGLGYEAGGLPPPLPSPAANSLVCHHEPRLPPSPSPAQMLSRRPSFGTNAQLRAPALAVGMEFSFSLVRIYVLSFPSLWIDRQFVIFSSSPSSSWVTRL
jgi:hypothetical protein